MGFIDDWVIEFQKRLLKNDKFTIISNDCWGAEVYRNFNLAYRTPFVGLFLMAPCYIKMLKNLRYYMDKAELTFVTESKYAERNEDRKAHNKFYPIGLLDNDIEIHFLHYKSDEEARETWTKRKERINWDDLLIKFDSGKDACTYELMHEFEKLPYRRKLCVGKQEFTGIYSNVAFDNWVVDGAKMYRISLEKANIISWLNGGTWRNTGIFYKLFYFLFIKNNKRFL